MLGVLLVFKSKCKKRKVPPPRRRVIWKSCPLYVWIRSVRPPFTGCWLSIHPRSTLNSKQENLECDTFLITPILRKHCRVTDSNYLLVQNRGYSSSPEVYTGSQGLWPYIFVVNIDYLVDEKRGEKNLLSLVVFRASTVMLTQVIWCISKIVIRMTETWYLYFVYFC